VQLSRHQTVLPLRKPDPGAGRQTDLRHRLTEDSRLSGYVQRERHRESSFCAPDHFIGAGLFDERLPAWQDLDMFIRILHKMVRRIWSVSRPMLRRFGSQRPHLEARTADQSGAGDCPGKASRPREAPPLGSLHADVQRLLRHRADMARPCLRCGQPTVFGTSQTGGATDKKLQALEAAKAGSGRRLRLPAPTLSFRQNTTKQPEQYLGLI